MSFAVDFALVHEIPSDEDQYGSIGVYQLTDGTLLAGLGTRIATGSTIHFLKSINDGQTWSEISTLDLSANDRGNRIAKFPGNILIYATEAPDFVDMHVHRSTNGGQTWSEVHTFTGDPTFTLATNLAFAAGTYDRDTAIITGRIADDGGTLLRSYALGASKGATWTLGKLLGPASPRPLAWSFANGASGLWIIGQGRNRLFQTTDFGANWTELSGLSGPSPQTDRVYYAATWVTDQIAVVGGLGVGNGWVNEPALWKTTDQGVSWTRNAAADIAEFTGPAHTAYFNEAKRMTVDSIAVGLSTHTTHTESPIRISLDAGATYPIVGSGWSFPSGDRMFAGGAISVSTAGSILCTVDRQGGDTPTSQIWRGRVTC